jgi:hypothetical protein
MSLLCTSSAERKTYKITNFLQKIREIGVSFHRNQQEKNTVIQTNKVIGLNFVKGFRNSLQHLLELFLEIIICIFEVALLVLYGANQYLRFI